MEKGREAKPEEKTVCDCVHKSLDENILDVFDKANWKENYVRLMLSSGEGTDHAPGRRI